MRKLRVEHEENGEKHGGHRCPNRSPNNSKLPQGQYVEHEPMDYDRQQGGRGRGGRRHGGVVSWPRETHAEGKVPSRSQALKAQRHGQRPNQRNQRQGGLFPTLCRHPTVGVKRIRVHPSDVCVGVMPSNVLPAPLVGGADEESAEREELVHPCARGQGPVGGIVEGMERGQSANDWHQEQGKEGAVEPRVERHGESCPQSS
mmetsp:Transcript_89229/g.161007  ORF Transcript_89229/g.161007 Transcript_89229/m.161007 type:complete len:202 (-) Transcript_89229:614-1219(-)